MGLSNVCVGIGEGESSSLLTYHHLLLSGSISISHDFSSGHPKSTSSLILALYLKFMFSGYLHSASF